MIGTRVPYLKLVYLTRDLCTLLETCVPYSGRANLFLVLARLIRDVRTYLISDEELVSDVGRVDERGPVHLGRVNTRLFHRVLRRQGGQ